MRQEWSPEDVVACWTLVDGDWELVANKSGPTRLGFVLMLKFFEIETRFPEFVEELPQPAVEYVAGLVKVSAAELAKYDLAGAKRHRRQIREALGFRPATLADENSSHWNQRRVARRSGCAPQPARFRSAGRRGRRRRHGRAVVPALCGPALQIGKGSTTPATDAFEGHVVSRA
ncbi:DUF4158 domain-containing protein [Streptomyces sp. NPDC059835]|uniref:DUF4158 domain-containing protein n=1 Tax=Streptomyces sp. NPDC059835 TaxID=3346967 RepID=UPI003648D3B1